MSTIAQIGAWVFAGAILLSLLAIPYDFFIFHPLLACLALVCLTEGITNLQPAHTQQEKKTGLIYHQFLNGLAATAIAAGNAIIFTNKVLNGKPHFQSLHSWFGVATLSYIVCQSLVGVSMVYFPNVFGGVQKARGMWRFHRMSGYAMLFLAWTTAVLGTNTSWARANLQPQFWVVVWGSVPVVLFGVVMGVRLSKFGIEKVAQKKEN
ncbi:uncharacterized protein VTP21DRAFT_5884 [Calcarisporiella thermophila]|uniref:uncharacterized protein n=1 Tax=Calcarisporiella thermophila TaxID=911321 RepID=UPI0037438E90